MTRLPSPCKDLRIAWLHSCVTTAANRRKKVLFSHRVIFLHFQLDVGVLSLTCSFVLLVTPNTERRIHGFFRRFCMASFALCCSLHVAVTFVLPREMASLTSLVRSLHDVHLP